MKRDRRHVEIGRVVELSTFSCIIEEPVTSRNIKWNWMVMASSVLTCNDRITNCEQNKISMNPCHVITNCKQTKRLFTLAKISRLSRGWAGIVGLHSAVQGQVRTALGSAPGYRWARLAFQYTSSDIIVEVRKLWKNDHQRGIIALDRQGTQQQRPESLTVTPPRMRVNTRLINSIKYTSSKKKKKKKEEEGNMRLYVHRDH